MYDRFLYALMRKHFVQREDSPDFSNSLVHRECMERTTLAITKG